MVTPEGHLKEDIIWRFIIGDNDDWGNYGEDYEGREVEFELYADGKKFNLTDGEGGNARGNLVLPRIKEDGGKEWQITVDTLPMYKIVNGMQTSTPIAWTVREVGATYAMGAGGSDIVASGVYLEEHFTVEAAGKDETTGVTPFDGDGYVKFTNTLNSQTTVRVIKDWPDLNEEEKANKTGSVYFDLYRTTVETEAESRDTEGAQKVIGDIALNAGNNWTYENNLLENRNDMTGDLWYYFAVEHSVAGYTTTYGINKETSKTQNITITNEVDGGVPVPISEKETVDGEDVIVDDCAVKVDVEKDTTKEVTIRNTYSSGTNPTTSWRSRRKLTCPCRSC
ncbi:MAG: hypothetical protein IJH86_07020 [Clostridia bacterium]|nr:hypothetical protein [Clostridia bacterium]